MQKIFQYDNDKCQVELSVPEILLVKEFAALLNSKRNICKQDKTGKLKLRAFREFYIYLACYRLEFNLQRLHGTGQTCRISKRF